jgi:hypothetical protein
MRKWTTMARITNRRQRAQVPGEGASNKEERWWVGATDNDNDNDNDTGKRTRRMTDDKEKGNNNEAATVSLSSEMAAFPY